MSKTNVDRSFFPGLTLLAMLMLLGAATHQARAQEVYQLDNNQWQLEAAPEPGTPEGLLQDIRKAIAQEHFDKARELASRWIKDHPNHPLVPEAYLLRGDAKVGQKNYFKALFDYERILRNYPGSQQFETALEREFHIARMFSNGVKRKLWGIRFVSAYGEAEEIFILTQERSPGSELGERASLELGDHFMRLGDMGQAAIAYEMFLKNYPRSLHREQAMLRLIQANLATFRGPRFDSTGLSEAAERIKMYGKEFPAAAEQLGADALLVRIDESLARQALKQAEWYEKRGNNVSAVTVYQRAVADYPRTAAAQDAAIRLDKLKAPHVAAVTGDTALLSQRKTNDATLPGLDNEGDAPAPAAEVAP